MNEFLAKNDFDSVNQLLAFEKEYIKQQTMSLLKLQEQNETLTHSVMISLSKEKKIQQEIKRKKMGILYYFRKCIDLKSPLIDNLFNVQSLVAPYTDLDGVKQDFYADKLEYIENMNKWGIEKNDKQHADVIFREKNNIKPIYQK